MAGESTTVVILGATGDLAKRKLLPALFNLGCKGRLPEGLKIVGYARSDYSDEAFREFICEEGRAIGGLGAQRSQWESFARNLHYVRGDVGSSDQMAGLDQRLTELETGAVPANRLFYLSLAPQLYEPAIRGLGASGIARAESGWRRAVVEKPFGRDLSTAQELNRVVKEVFEEEQLFRIDHYLGKETVQNLLVLRFANAIFEPLWHRNHVDNIQITVSEEVAVGDRGGYYDQSGVVRDMLQNHLLQLLTMVAMEPPNSRDSESLRDKKVEILKAIRRWEPGDVYRHTVRGQYRGYRDEKGVPPGLFHGHLRGSEVLHRQLALARGAFLPADWESSGLQGVGDYHPVQVPLPRCPFLLGRTRTRPQTCWPYASSPTKASIWEWQPRYPTRT